MNKLELELINLVDLAFVSQDYETASHNAKIPYSEFKNCKAFRHSASCQEVLLLSSIGFDPSFVQPNNNKEVDQMAENAYNLYHKANR